MLSFDRICPECLEKLKKSEADFIHSRQIKAGFEPCFGEKKECNEMNCCFRLLCLAKHREAEKPKAFEGR
jgi:hypothetical protein